MTASDRCKIEVTVPPEHADAVLQAMGAAGAGRVGEYRDCAFVTPGRGRFTASENAHPAVGEAGAFSEVDEVLIQSWCSRVDARAVVAAIRASHPYEEPVIYLIPLLGEVDLP